MNQLDLRPLSIGEVLDRTFTLYRQNFALFLGLAGIPALAPLALQLAQLSLGLTPLTGTYWIFLLLVIAVSVVAYLFSQGGTVLAVSRLYLNRPTSIGESLSAVNGNFGALFAVSLLTGLAVGVGAIFFIIPGVYIACRLLISVPCALIEQRGPSDALRRSWDLTKGHAGGAFLICLLVAILTYAISAVAAIPAGASVFTRGVAAAADPSVLIITMLLSAIGSILVRPVMLIATAIFYYDLRVRKEAFDLQIMMDPDGSQVPRANMNSIIPE